MGRSAEGCPDQPFNLLGNAMIKVLSHTYNDFRSELLILRATKTKTTIRLSIASYPGEFAPRTTRGDAATHRCKCESSSCTAVVGTNRYSSSSGSRSSKTRNHLQQRAESAHITTGRSGCVDVCKGDFRKGDIVTGCCRCGTARLHKSPCAVNIGGGSKPQDRSTTAGFRATSLDFVFRGVSFNQY